MPGLTSLPVELGQQIWSYMILPDDIESYSLVCRPIYHHGTKVITEHRRLRDQFTSVGNSISTLASEPKGTTYLEIPQMLELFIANPVHALYVKNLVINRWHDGFEAEQTYKIRMNGHRLHSCLVRDEGPWFTPYSSTTLRIFEQAIRRSKYVDPASMRNWIDCVKSGQQGPLLVLLLTMLSKLQNITIHRVGGDYLGVLDNIDSMLKSSKLTMLPSLTSVELSDTLDRGYSRACGVFFHLSPVRRRRL